MSARYQSRVDALVRLIEHPNTPPTERGAAEAAYHRLTGKTYPRCQSKQEAPKQAPPKQEPKRSKHYFTFDYKTMLERDLLFKCAHFVAPGELWWRQVPNRRQVEIKLSTDQRKALVDLYASKREALEYRMDRFAEQLIKEWFG